jgi:protein-tyrosine phosphatase
MAILVAAAIFLVMPLKFSFPRPHVEGWLGVIFDRFRAVDLPYNQFPSLHIALRTILADLYARHTRRAARVASDVWFSLIGASTLLTYQHHVADVAGGFLLALLCFYFVSGDPWRLPVTRNARVGGYYLGGAGVLAALAALLWPWGAVLLWPAASLAIVSSGYFGLGAAVFRKRNGQLPVATRILLAPTTLGQRLSLMKYARRSRAWDVVTPNVWIGRTLTRREAADALARGVTAILDVTGELPEAAPFARHPNYLNLPILDLTAPTAEQIRAAVEFIDRHARAGGVVYVHCKAGYSRSAAVVASYLLHAGLTATPQQAWDALRACRPEIIVRPEALACVAGPSPRAAEPAPLAAATVCNRRHRAYTPPP